MIGNKLCYILPEYDENTGQHFYHIYDLLEPISKIIDLFLVIERAKDYPKNISFNHVYIQKFQFYPLRFLELIVVCLYARLKGYNKFYAHYTYFGGICSSLVVKILGGKTYYWNCGLKGEFMHKWKLNLPTIKDKIFEDYGFLFTLKLVNYLVTGTKTMADYYSKNFGMKKERIRVIPNWVNVERFNPLRYDKQQLRDEMNIQREKKVILYAHRIVERKGAQHLVKICREVKKKIPDVIFLVVGDGPYRRKLEEEIKNEKVEGVMEVVGNVPNKDIMRYYAISDVFIMPSEEEGFPRVLIEAMAMGIPFVATDVGGVTDIITEEEKKFVVPKGEILKFSRKVIAILKNDELREELRKEGFVNVKNYTKEKVVERFVQVIK